MNEQQTKLYIALGAAFTLFAMMLLNTWRRPDAPPAEWIYLLLFILSTTLGIDLFRGSTKP